MSGNFVSLLLSSLLQNTAEEVLHVADKEAGRNCVVLWKGIEESTDD